MCSRGRRCLCFVVVVAVEVDVVVGRLVFVLLSASPSKSLWSPCNSAMITLWHLVIVGFLLKAGFPGLFQGWFSWFFSRRLVIVVIT
jgi:hypothetical protein